ncbi:MAG: hypothetical protein H6Q25_574 [Bacteroidetes bacterium]|nr:hypothetical protein [Bacteroidota bacterium]
MKKWLTILLFISISLNSIAQSKVYFPNLTRVSIDTTYNVFFSYEQKCTRLINKPCFNLDRNNPYFCDLDSVNFDWVLVAKFKNDKTKDTLTILYAQGMSDDPAFKITNNKHEIIKEFYCLEFYINGSGTIYTSGHTNNMFDRRRKFQIQNDSIMEIIQPFNYVGLKGKTLKPITLYKDRTGNDIVAQLPKDYEIEILLADGTSPDFEVDTLFLVKTDFGLVGWLRITEDDIYRGILYDFFYAGD